MAEANKAGKAPKVTDIKAGKSGNTSDDESTASGVLVEAENSKHDDIPAEPTDSAESSEAKDEEQKEEVKQKCEVRAFEARYDANGGRELRAVGDETKKEIDSDDEKRKYGLCSYKYYSRSGEVEEESVEIMSSHIIKALQKVIGEYPDAHFGSEQVTIEAPYKCVFHYRQELTKYADELEDREEASFVRLLLTFVDKELRRGIAQYEANVINASENPSITYQYLWMVYKPGQLIYCGHGQSLRCLEVVDTLYRTGQCAAFVVQGNYFSHDGTYFGYITMEVGQAPYKGMKALTKVRAVHEKYIENEAELREKLVLRGKKYVEHHGSHYRSYTGLAQALSTVQDWNSMGEYREEATIIKSRVMIDAKMFGIMKSPNRIELGEQKGMPEDVTAEEIGDYITEQDMLIADFRIPGYAFEVKRWCWFNVDFIQSVILNTEAFPSLILPTGQKQLLRGLVKTHVSGTDEFDDLISGKGKGLCFVLWGPPGIGKTFTAESIADHIERPLYALNSGELGIEPIEVEEKLSFALMLATAWNAILLIDEADVFLEQRSVKDLKRNCLVSIFLRTLEYYEGIVFLTTNRITTFDPAFRSRVHLALRYHPLDQEKRKALWKTFISRTSKNPPSLGDDVLNRLAAVDVNGRQIKNAVRTANAVARSEDVPLNEEHLSGVLQAIAEFEADFRDETIDDFGQPVDAVQKR